MYAIFRNYSDLSHNIITSADFNPSPLTVNKFTPGIIT